VEGVGCDQGGSQGDDDREVLPQAPERAAAAFARSTSAVPRREDSERAGAMQVRAGAAAPRGLDNAEPAA
jgi:hypothetical protein